MRRQLTHLVSNMPNLTLFCFIFFFQPGRERQRHSIGKISHKQLYFPRCISLRTTLFLGCVGGILGQGSRVSREPSPFMHIWEDLRLSVIG